jgi:hypothetical protein
MRMSSSMRCRSGETAPVDGFMILLLLVNEADCLAQQHRRTRQPGSCNGLAEGATA